jgi:hypothetical protein
MSEDTGFQSHVRENLKPHKKCKVFVSIYFHSLYHQERFAYNWFWQTTFSTENFAAFGYVRILMDRNNKEYIGVDHKEISRPNSIIL